MTSRRAPDLMHLRGDHLLWLVGGLCRIHRIPFDPRLLAQAFPPPHSRETLWACARAYGLKAGEVEFLAASADELIFPAVAFARPAPAESSQGERGPAELSHIPPAGADARAEPSTVVPLREPAPAGLDTAPGRQEDPWLEPVLVLKLEGEQLVYFRPGADAPETVAVGDFRQRFEPRLLLVVPDPAAAAEAGVSPVDAAEAGLASGPEKFGFRWFIPELLKHQRIFRDVLLASFALQLVGLATPLFTQVVIDKVVVHHTQSTLAVIAVGLGLFLVFNAVMTWLRQYLVLHTGTRIDAALGARVFRHLVRLPLRYFEYRPTGTLIARVQGVETVRVFLTGAAVSMLDLPFLLIFLAVMVFYSWQLTLVAAAALVLISGASLAVTPLVRERLNRQFLLGARNQAFLTEYVAGIETVKSLQAEPVLERRYRDYFAGYLAAGFRTRQLGNTFSVAANTLEQTMTLAILVIGALLVMRNDGFTIGMLVAFQMFAGRMSQPLLRLVGLWQEFQQASIAVKRLGDVLDAPTEPNALVPTRATDAAGRIEFVNVSFRYAEDRPYVYQGLNLQLSPGKLHVLTGPSGCGKSTLAKLLQGFYRAADGVIRLDGQDIRHLPANELRANFGVVPQETVLFSGTVYDNVLLGNPHASFDDVAAACKLAEVHDVIQALPQGYQTLLGEHGVGLSGGQKQRLAIARALLKRPKVLIFDEATSQLDIPTVESLARTINALKGRMTILFITHQLPKGLAPDEIFSLTAPPARPDELVEPARRAGAAA